LTTAECSDIPWWMIIVFTSKTWKYTSEFCILKNPFKRAFYQCTIFCQTIRLTKTDFGPPDYCRMHWYAKMMDDHFFACEFWKYTSELCTLRNPLKKALLWCIILLLKHQTDKKWCWTSQLLPNAVMQKNEWSFFHIWNLKIHKWIMHPQKSFEMSFLMVYNMFPNHLTDKKWLWTFQLLQNAVICKKRLDDNLF